MMDNIKKCRKPAITVGVTVLIIVLVISLFGCSKGEDKASDVSSEKIYNFPSASEENDMMKMVRSIEAEGKVCYLTFDDGPTNEVTPAVLDVLKDKNVKATFFCLGKMLAANPEIAKRAFDEGHLIANHSYNHSYNELYATAESFMQEIIDTENKIREITGEDPFRLFRFPGGGQDAGDHAAEKQIYKEVLKKNGYYFADWNCLNGDAEGHNVSPDELLNKIKGTAIEKHIVVLMHDAATKKTTPQALGSIIDYLKEKGYEFKRLDEIDYYDTGLKKVVESDMIL